MRKTIAIALALFMSVILIMPITAFADSMADQCLNFDFPSEDQKLAVADTENLTETERTQLDSFITTFYNSFGCDVGTISFVKYEPNGENGAEVHVVFSDDSFHKWEAKELMRSTGYSDEPETGYAEADEQEFGNESEVNKEELKAALDRAQTYVDNEKVPEELREKLKEAIVVAQAVYEDPDATQAAVDEQAAILNALIKDITDALEEDEVPITADFLPMTMFLVLGASLVGVIIFGRKVKSYNH